MVNDRKITCILPVYNNEETVERTLLVLLSVKPIDKIVAVDDGSKDNSYKILEKFNKEIKVLRNKENLGKGSAFIKGFKASTSELILTCDADHRNLTKEHIENIINEYAKGKSHMVVAARESDQGWGSLMARITGERIFERKSIEKYIDLIEESRYGMEQIINHAHKQKSIGVVVSRNIGHILKYKRKNPFKIIKDYILQIGQIIKTGWKLRKY